MKSHMFLASSYSFIIAGFFSIDLEDNYVHLSEGRKKSHTELLLTFIWKQFTSGGHTQPQNPREKFTSGTTGPTCTPLL
jgi:hypothetical protein